MKKSEIKKGCSVIDRWYMNYGVGKITDVKETVFTVDFDGKEIKYDFPHAQFLDKYKIKKTL